MEGEDDLNLHQACSLGDMKAIKRALFADPTRVNQRDESVPHTQLGWTPLYRCIISGNRSTSKFLLQHGADPSAATQVFSTQTCETPLHRAADNSQHSLAALLLKHGADANKQQADGETPLHHAAFRGDIVMVGMLLEYQADPNVRNLMFGRTPLHVAVDCGHADCVRAMLAYGGDIRLGDKVRSTQYGKTVWDMARKEEIRNILRKVDAGGEIEGQTLPTRGEYAVDSEDSSDSDRVSMSSHNTIGVVLEGLSLPQSDEFTERSLTDTVLEKRTSILNSYHNSLGSVQKPAPGSVRQSASGKPWSDLGPLQEWLDKRNLGETYQLLTNAGFDDVEEIVAMMKSSTPITDGFLLKVGIRKPGHRKRLLMRLEEEAGLFVPPPLSRQPVARRSTSVLPCCDAPNNASTFGVSLSHPLRDWLHSIKLDACFDLFQASGYDDFQSLVHLMSWSQPMTDEVLQTEVGILKPGHRSRILSRLQEEALGFSRGSIPTVFEPGDRATACEMCRMMMAGVRWFAMSLEEVEATVFEVVKRFDKVDPNKVTRTSSFADLGLDSLDAVESVVAMEDKFGVDLEDSEAMKIASLKDAISVFHKHKAK